MKFSGHETFALRHGWLHKGMRLLIESPGLWQDEYVADWLGVGRNMAKSIKHWMISSGLATNVPTKKGLIQPTKLGKIVYDYDPYFSDQGTLWFLHINLATNLESVTTWYWFFNNFSHSRFEKSTCLNQLWQFLQSRVSNVPSIKTLERDLQCLLASYSKNIPNTIYDPEDAYDCPFSELGILNHYNLSGSYELNSHYKDVPAHAIGYSLSLAFGTNNPGGVPFTKVVSSENSPGRVFALSSEPLFEEMLKAENNTNGDIKLVGLAGERVVIYKDVDLLEWVVAHYQDESIIHNKPKLAIVN